MVHKFKYLSGIKKDIGRVRKKSANICNRYCFLNNLICILKKFFSLFYYSYFDYRRNRVNILNKKYKVYRILFFKFKFKILPVMGKNNRIFIREKGITKEVQKILPNIHISIEGDNNIIDIGDIKQLHNCNIQIKGDHNKVQICDSKYRISLNICMEYMDNYRELIIGKNLLAGNTRITLMGNKRKVSIGEDCMFSSDINIWTTDGHPIYDLNTGNLINEDKDISIGNHVWLARNVSIHKGAVIPDNCVVGAHAIVTKEFSEPNCLIAGIPAKILKKNIRWEREY